MTKTANIMHRAIVGMLLSSVAPLAGSAAFVLATSGAQAQTVSQVSIAERTPVSAVLFSGNKRFSDAQLTAMVELASRRVYSQAAVQADLASIRSAYDQAGYTNVSVTAKPESASDGGLRVTYVVNEGDRAGVASINFTGNNSINSGVLKNAIMTKESHLLSWLFRDDLYDENKLAVDREMLRLYYANRGYPDVRILSSIGEFDAAKNAYFINYTIEEGERYSFGDIAIETSIPGLNTAALRGSVLTNSGGRYAIADLAKSTEALAVGATKQGFSFSEVRPRIDRDVVNKRFNVTYLIDEGPRVYVERINIVGNDKTRDFVIRREFDFSEGDPFNRVLVTRGRSSIEGLGYFKSVQVTAEQGSAPDKVVLNVAVVEQSTGDYGIGAGYSSTQGLFGELSMTERNFLGRGQFIRAAVGRSESGESYDFSFTEPRFMGLKVSAGIDAYRSVVGQGESYTYGTETNGARLRFGIPVVENLTFGLYAGIEQKSFNRTNDDAIAPPAYIPVGGSLDKLTVGYSLAYNTLDNQRRPSKGIVANFSQEYATLSHNFLKTEVRARVYYPVWEEANVIGSLRAQGGIINDLGSDGIHPTESFILGPTLVRGFNAGGMGYRRDGGTKESFGALTYAGISAEVEFPVPVLPETWGLRGAVWGDLGWFDGLPNTQGEAAINDTVNPLKSSVGASIIWDSPMGPLRGDFAHVIDKDEQDRIQLFQLSLSSQF